MIEIADSALRSIIKQTERGDCNTDFDRAYLAGQVDIIQCYFSPDARLLDQAKKAVAKLARKAA